MMTDEEALKHALDEMELELTAVRGALARIIKLEDGELGELKDPAFAMVRIAREALAIDN